MTPLEERTRDHARLLLSEAGAAQFRSDFAGEDVFDGFGLFHAVRFLAQRMHDASALWLEPYGVTATKFYYLALLYLRRKTKITAGDVAAAARTTSGSVTAMIDALEREGLVSRRTHPKDTRRVMVRLTAKGERLYLQCAAARNERVAAIARTLGTEQTRALLGLLVETGNALHEITPESAHPQLLNV